MSGKSCITYFWFNAQSDDFPTHVKKIRTSASWGLLNANELVLMGWPEGHQDPFVLQRCVLKTKPTFSYSGGLLEILGSAKHFQETYDIVSQMTFEF